MSLNGIFQSEFFKSFNVGHLTLIIIALIGFGRLMQRIDDLEKAGPVSAALAEVERSQIIELQRRVDVHDSIFRDIVPKLETLNDNVLTLMARDKK